MKQPIYIMGHKNPDTDSICSTIAYSYLKNELGYNAIPVRLGNINRETQFVLSYFDCKQPSYLATMKPKVSDLTLDKLETITKNTSIKHAWQLMHKQKTQLIPIVDENEKFIAVVTLSDITNTYFNPNNNNFLSKSNTPLESIIQSLDGELLTGDINKIINSGKILIGAMSHKEMATYIEEGDIIITGNRTKNQITAINKNVSCIVVTGNLPVKEEVISLATEKNCPIIKTPLDTFTASRIILQAAPVESIMNIKNIISFDTDDFIDEVKEKMIAVRHKIYPVLDKNDKVIGGLARYHLISRISKNVILVDHNEISQSVKGIENAKIIEIIDHHRLGGLQTNYPIYIRNEPVGSTSTIIARLYEENNIAIPPKIAGLLCAAILSDTLHFRSPTSTERDKNCVTKLSKIANINIENFSAEMFKAGSSLEGRTEEDIVFGDFKEFQINNYKIGIGQVITIDIDSLNPLKPKIIKFLKEASKNDDYDIIMLLLTDIFKEDSELLFEGDNKNLISEAYNIKGSEKSIYLKNVVSRKKQVVPKIANYLNKQS